MMDWLPGLSATTRLILEGVISLSARPAGIGCFAVLRRRALVGDALSHAALPGLFVGYLVFFFVAGPEHTNEPPPLLYLLVGALAAGVLGILAISALRRWTRIKEDAAIGIVLSGFFFGGLGLDSIIQRTPS